MRAIILNCTLKPSPAESNTAALAEVAADSLRKRDVTIDAVRVVDANVPPGVESDLGEGDDWPGIRQRILDADILVVATPTWLGQPSSVAKRVLERMDAMLAETDDAGRPVAYNHVAGVVVTGNGDGAHHVISEVSGALVDIGFTIPGQSWTYWNAGPGPSYLEADHARTGRSRPATRWRRTSSRSPARSPPSRSRHPRSRPA
jgi:multimeric flavodoxin WrbA